MGNCHGLGFRGLGSGVGISWFFGFGGAAKTNLVRDFSFFFTSSLFACSSVCPSVPPDLIVRPRFGVWGLGSRRNKLVSVTFVFVFLHRRSFTFSSVRPSDRPSRSKSFVHSSACSTARLRSKFVPEIFVSVSLRRVTAFVRPFVRSVHSSAPSVRGPRMLEGLMPGTSVRPFVRSSVYRSHLIVRSSIRTDKQRNKFVSGVVVSVVPARRCVSSLPS